MTCFWCGKEAVDTHHLFRRSSKPEWIENPDNLLPLCRKCHDYATNEKVFEELLQQTFFAKQREPKLSIEYIAKELQERSNISPREIVRFRNWLAGEYVFLSTRYVEAKIQKAITFHSYAQVAKSMAAAEREVDVTIEGKECEFYKQQLASIEQLQSALFTAHRQLEKESYNIM